MTENVKKELDQLGDIIDAKLEKAHGQAVESATGNYEPFWPPKSICGLKKIQYHLWIEFYF